MPQLNYTPFQKKISCWKCKDAYTALWILNSQQSNQATNVYIHRETSRNPERETLQILPDT